MSIADKTKTALDETRMLMLGAQILLGFELQAPFRDAFSSASAAERATSVTVLCLLVLAVGLIVAPSAHHRIVEEGEASAPFNRLITRLASVTLPPFALALALDVAMAAGRAAGSAAAVLAGLFALVLAAGFWCGPLLFAERRPESAMTTSDKKTPTAAKIDFILTESRVVLPGAQALLGFQLAMVFTDSFEALDRASKSVHGAALMSTTLAIVLLIAPAAYHRTVYAGEDSAEFHRIGSVLITASTVPLAAALAADVYVVAGKVLDSPAGALGLALACLAFLIGAWHVLPLVAKARLARAER